MSSNAIAMKWSLFSKIKEEETTHQDKHPSSLKQEQHMAYTIKPQIYKKKKKKKKKEKKKKEKEKSWHFISFFFPEKKKLTFQRRG